MHLRACRFCFAARVALSVHVVGLGRPSRHATPGPGSLGAKRRLGEVFGCLGRASGQVSDAIHAACRHIEILEDVDHQNLTSRTRKALAKQACNVMDSEKLGPFTLKFLRPNKMLFCVLEANSDLRQNFERCLQKYPPPWHVVWGADECFSGNALHESGRKVLAL